MARQQTTYRQRVLDVIQSATGDLTGQEVALRSGLTYRQTIDALNALYNMAKVSRSGRKFTARWSKTTEPPTSTRANTALLNKIFARWNR